MDIEKNIIGSMVKRPELIPEVFDITKPTDFTDSKSAIVYSTLVDMVKADEAIDLVTVGKKLAGKIDLAWLSETVGDVMTSARTKKHAKIVADIGRARRLKVKLKNLSTNMVDPDETLTEMLDIYSSELSGETKSGHISDVIKRFHEVIKENKKGGYGLDTGYQFLEDKFIRYMPGQIWIIGAWTSVGKTAMMVDMLCRAIELHDPTIAIISTEMLEEQNVARFLARQTGFNSNVVLSGGLHASNQQELDDSIAWFNRRSLYLYDNLYSFQDIEMRLRQLTMKKKVDIVFIDYIQNMTFAGAKSEYESKSEIAKGLQRIAKQLKTCIVCLSQIPNSAIKEDSEILEYKGAGEIAAVADLGIRLKKDKDNKEHIKFIIGKNRHGKLGTQVLQYVNHFTRLKEIKHADNE